MGLLTDTVLENLTDYAASRVAAAVVTPAPNMLLANTNTGLASYLDGATEDALLQAALLSSCSAIDRQALAPNYRAYVQSMIERAEWKALFAAIQRYVVSADGGGYADFPTYIAAVDAELHPLVGEVLRSQMGETAFGASGAISGVMHPLMQAVDFDRVYTGAQGALVDDTTDAASVAAADVAIFAADDTIVALGSRHRFDTILFDLSTPASVDCVLLAYYWNGTAWAALSITDTTTGISANEGMISFTAPSDWEPHAEDMQGTPAAFDTAQEGQLYYVILQRTEDTVVTPPVATWFQCVPEAIEWQSGLYGVDQPPLAIVQITDTDTCTVTVVQQPDITRFECPKIANNALKLVAINDFAADITFTLGYTDQDGNAATHAQAAWSAAIAAGDTANIALAGGDTGLQTIAAATCTISTNNTAGIFLVTLADYPRSVAAK